MTDRIRGRRLQQIRAAHFRRDPACPRCAEAGVLRLWEELDHVIPLSQGGLDVDVNRIGLCAEHHAIKTARDQGYAYKPRKAKRPGQRIGLDGYPIE